MWGNAEAATYYSDFSTGSDSNNGISTATPWKHMPGMSGWTGSATLTSGDTIVLKGGVTWIFASTTDNLLTVSTSGITIKGGQQLDTPWGNGHPVLDGLGTSASRDGIYINGVSNVVIDGLKIYRTYFDTGDDADASGTGLEFRYAVNGLEIKNCIFDLCGVDSLGGNPSTGSNGIRIHHNTFSNSGRVHIMIDDNNSVDDIQIYNNILEGVGTWYPVYWEENLISAAGSGYEVDDVVTVVQAGGSGATIRITSINGSGGVTGLITTSRGTGYHEDLDTACNTINGHGAGFKIYTGGYHGDGIMIGSDCTNPTNNCLTNTKIYNNIFRGDWSSAGATALIYLNNGAGEGGTQYGGNHILIYNNQLAIDSEGIISPAYISIWSLWNDIKIYNNTFGGYFAGGEWEVSSCISSWHEVTNIDIKNNIFSGATNSAVTIGTSAVATTLSADYNLYSPELVRLLNGWPPGNADCRTIPDAQSSPFFQEAHGIQADPKFVTRPTGETNSGNWHLASDSPAIKAGVNLSSYFTTDCDGNTRPSSGAWDMGAYEYGVVSNDTTPPAAPSGLAVS